MKTTPQCDKCQRHLAILSGSDQNLKWQVNAFTDTSNNISPISKDINFPYICHCSLLTML